MKLEIELDLNQIDYAAINKQIQDKIAEMNIREEYKIDNVARMEWTYTITSEDLRAMRGS